MKYSNSPKAWYLSLAIVVIIALWLTTLIVLPRIIPLKNDASDLGNMFGALEALFAGLAFACLVYAIYLQRIDLRIQKDALEQAKDDFKSNLELIKHQVEHLDRSTQYKVFMELTKEYKSSEMHIAVSTLWDFYYEHKDDLIENYINKQALEENTFDIVTHTPTSVLITTSLHYYRKQVSQYYQCVVCLRKIGVIPPELLFSYWNSDDLKILPKIIIPIEKHLLERSLSTNQTSIMGLQELYEESLKFSA